MAGVVILHRRVCGDGGGQREKPLWAAVHGRQVQGRVHRVLVELQAVVHGVAGGFAGLRVGIQYTAGR